MWKKVGKRNEGTKWRSRKFIKHKQGFGLYKTFFTSGSEWLVPHFHHKPFLWVINIYIFLIHVGFNKQFKSALYWTIQYATISVTMCYARVAWMRPNDWEEIFWCVSIKCVAVVMVAVTSFWFWRSLNWVCHSLLGPTAELNGSNITSPRDAIKSISLHTLGVHHWG